MLCKDKLRPDIKWYSRQKLHYREKRKYPFTDPLLPDQWHLSNFNTTREYVHINAEKSWELGYSGKGIVIGFIDDGLQFEHPDIFDNYIAKYSWNYNLDSADVSPNLESDKYWHGTSAAGAAAAVADGKICGVGVAYNASIAAIVLLQQLEISDVMESRALQHSNRNIHIYSNSWGPRDNSKLNKPGTLTAMTIENSIKYGRGGKGSIYVWAVGNGRESYDDCNYDRYSSNRLVITVGATDDVGVHTSYSERCSALLGVVPVGSNMNNIRTTGISDNRNELCNIDFSGTSAAAPLVSGIVALILEANSNLSWIDVQYVLQKSTDKNDPTNDSWDQNKAGIWYSTDYGFGIFDSFKAVKNAMSYTDYIVESTLIYNMHVFDYTFPMMLVDVDITQIMVIHHVELEILMYHKYRGNIEISLTSPGGTLAQLARKHPDFDSDYIGWTFTALNFWGETSNGVWQLSISEKDTLFPDRNAFLETFKVRIYGTNDNGVPIEVIDIKLNNNTWNYKNQTFPDLTPDSNFWKRIFMFSLIILITLIVIVVIIVFKVRKYQARKDPYAQE
eukprot:TRINITY_DN2189_c1_g1_i1.p1 TRINITY_DN2189_c1_g1~~TRINITY_DN2189_c1_g1_i1.p1  ORF type:complete len:561 (-),score=123.01 TRINITY_DN2189_c1_g1_i1:171-1853(-)